MIECRNLFPCFVPSPGKSVATQDTGINPLLTRRLVLETRCSAALVTHVHGWSSQASLLRRFKVDRHDAMIMNLRLGRPRCRDWVSASDACCAMPLRLLGSRAAPCTASLANIMSKSSQLSAPMPPCSASAGPDSNGKGQDMQMVCECSMM